MTISILRATSLSLLCCAGLVPAGAQSPPILRNANGLKLLVARENTAPTLRVILPGRPVTDRSVEIVFPEHVTLRKEGETATTRVYLWQPGMAGQPPAWHTDRHSLSYELQLADGLQMRAQATLESDGVRLRYEFVNHSAVGYSMVYAPTDPRLTGDFHDPRLERTFVHHKDGFDLLASETPARLTLPLNQWLPARYHASFTWPVPAHLVTRDPDGITNYDKSRPVDQPMIATLSRDRRWVIASFTRTTGNVWSNPELTCQHVDPEPPLPAGGRAVVEVKILVFRGSLAQALRDVIAERPTLE